MNTAKKLTVVGVALALGMSAAANAAKQKEEDSVYKWGRWAVLSPAAGGEPYVATLEPAAANNKRPGEADEFQPKVKDDNNPPVEVAGFCQAGAACGYATYSKMPDNSAQQVSAAQVINVGEFNSTSDNPDGPVLARFSLEKGNITDPEVASTPESTADPVTVMSFQVTDAAAPGFPDIQSVAMVGDFDNGDLQGTDSQASFNGDLGAIVTNSKTSSLSHSHQGTGQQYRFDGVNAGYWSQLGQRQLEYILGEGGEMPSTNVLEDSRGYFVVGTTATIEQMESFAAGNAIASYSGYVLDYAAPMELTFDFGARTWNGSFSSANGFNGFDINGAVDGANFAAQDGAGREVSGSFFNAGFNASGAANDGTKVGVFSADYNGGASEGAR